ncbi:MAG: radical SAM protein [Spirochaetales bacterium]|nr:radical SAM protein [Spirochaetales bacterium]
MKLKALLIQPPIHDFYLSPERFTALGLKTLIPILEDEGYSWDLINFPLAYRKGHPTPLPSELSYLKPFIIQGETGPVSWFRGYHRYGPGPIETCKSILDKSPDILLISCFAWAYAAECLEMIRDLKTAAPDIPIIAGGPGVAAEPEYFQGPHGADFIYTGEAEAGFQKLLKYIKSNQDTNDKEGLKSIPNLYINKEVGPPLLTSCEDLYPVWSLSEMRGGTHYTTMLSRGCPRKCRFCSNFLVQGRTFRKIPVDAVLASIDCFPQEGPLSINFEDDNLLLAPDYFIEILTALKAHNPAFSFTAENGMEYTLLNESLLAELKGLGLSQLNISLAVSSQRIAGSQERFLNLEKYSSVVQSAEKLNIPVITYFICGLEGDTPESIVEILLYLTARPTSIGISPFYPVPGLPGLDKYDFRKIYPGLCRGSSSYPWMGNLSTAQIVTAFRLARYSNLFHRYKSDTADFDPLLSELISVSLIKKRLHTIIRKNRKMVIIELSGMDISMMEQYLTGVKEQIRPIG